MENTNRTNVDRNKSWIYSSDHDSCGGPALDSAMLLRRIPTGVFSKDDMYYIMMILRADVRLRQDAHKVQSLEGTYQQIAEDLEPIIMYSFDEAFYEANSTAGGQVMLTYTEIDQIAGACNNVQSVDEYGLAVPLSYIPNNFMERVMYFGCVFDDLSHHASMNGGLQTVFEAYC